MYGNLETYGLGFRYINLGYVQRAGLGFSMVFYVVHIFYC